MNETQNKRNSISLMSVICFSVYCRFYVILIEKNSIISFCKVKLIFWSLSGLEVPDVRQVVLVYSVINEKTSLFTISS